MSGCVTVSGPPRAICALNFGTTEPTDPSTLPNRTAMSRVAPSRPVNSASWACAYISASRFVTPSMETGSIALPLEVRHVLERRCVKLHVRSERAHHLVDTLPVAHVGEGAFDPRVAFDQRRVLQDVMERR